MDRYRAVARRQRRCARDQDRRCGDAVVPRHHIAHAPDAHVVGSRRARNRERWTARASRSRGTGGTDRPSSTRCGHARNAFVRLQDRSRDQAATPHHARRQRSDERGVGRSRATGSTPASRGTLHQMNRPPLVVSSRCSSQRPSQRRRTPTSRSFASSSSTRPAPAFPRPRSSSRLPPDEPVTFTSDERGVATSPSLPVGAAKLHVEFGGFEPFDGTAHAAPRRDQSERDAEIAGVKEEVVVSDTDGHRRSARQLRRRRRSSSRRSRRCPTIPTSSPMC